MRLSAYSNTEARVERAAEGGVAEHVFVGGAQGVHEPRVEGEARGEGFHAGHGAGDSCQESWETNQIFLHDHCLRKQGVVGRGQRDSKDESDDEVVSTPKKVVQSPVVQKKVDSPVKPSSKSTPAPAVVDDSEAEEGEEEEEEDDDDDEVNENYK